MKRVVTVCKGMDVTYSRRKEELVKSPVAGGESGLSSIYIQGSRE